MNNLYYKHDTNQINVLIVDTCCDDIIKLKFFLRQFQCVVTVASNGLEAILMHSKDSFDLIFIEISLPLLNGFKATSMLRALEGARGLAKSTIIAHSKNHEQDVYRRSSGFDGYLNKPLSQFPSKKRILNNIRKRQIASKKRLTRG